MTNPLAAAISSWTVELDTNQSTLYTSWDGSFSGSSGQLTVSLAFDWHRVIEPGGTESSVGFCANRATSDSGPLPFVTNASGVF